MYPDALFDAEAENVGIEADGLLGIHWNQLDMVDFLKMLMFILLVTQLGMLADIYLRPKPQPPGSWQHQFLV
ncbi:MAG: hypothetical protein PHG44_02940 [Lentisphaeria bacterium]|nr:hypothetical protein [Lentisphaeria bacterium]NLZ59643.1 hypothetical protein [Lentisphaerota bacterium]